MIQRQIRELDGKIAEKALELKSHYLTDLDKLIKTTELTELLNQQNQMLKQHIENTKKNGSTSN